jgi:metallo-beta-lactamase family protein
MANLILLDSAKVQASDIARINRKRERAGEPFVEPLYTAEHVTQIVGQFQPVRYNETIAVAPGIEARFVEAGHMLGSASIQLSVRENGATRKVVFSGDLGPKGAPILKDFQPFHDADLMILESTYGDRDHKPLEDTVREFFDIVNRVVTSKGKMLVPTFAVGRAQLLIVLLACAFRHGRVPEFPIFLDSPMAIEASRIYTRHPELFDEDMLAMLKERPIMQDLGSLKITPTAEDSRKINDVPGPCMILAGAGMCNAGRIVHHLKQNLWRPETHVLIVGYQGEGTLGRMLVNGATEVKIFGEKVAVRASIHTLGGFSAHAGQTDLLAWLSAVAPQCPRVVLSHGEDRARRALARKVKEKFGITSELAAIGQPIRCE